MPDGMKISGATSSHITVALGLIGRGAVARHLERGERPPFVPDRPIVSRCSFRLAAVRDVALGGIAEGPSKKGRPILPNTQQAAT